MRTKLRVNDYLFLIVENTFITPTSCPNRTNETNTPVGNTKGSIKIVLINNLTNLINV